MYSYGPMAYEPGITMIWIHGYSYGLRINDHESMKLQIYLCIFGNWCVKY